jgi:hypothetical protein
MLLALMIYFIKLTLFALTIVFIFAVFEADRFIKADRSVKFIEERSVPPLSPDFTISQLLGELYVRLVFDIIYIKVVTGSYIRSKFKLTYILTNLFCITLLGISKKGIKLIYIILKHRSYDGIVDFLASRLTTHGKTRRVLFMNGVWKTNGSLFFKIVIRFEARFSSEQTIAVANAAMRFDDAQLDGFMCKTVVGQHTSVNNKKSHFFVECILKDKTKLGLCSDDGKAESAFYYHKPLLLKGVLLNKKTSILEADMAGFSAEKPGRLIHSDKLIKAATRWGYDPIKFTDRFNDDFYKHKLILEDIEAVLADRDLFSESEAAEARKIIYDIDFF